MQYDAKVSEYLLELLRSALNETLPAEKPENVEWQSVFSMAKKHGVSALCFSVLQNLKSGPEEELFLKWKTMNAKLLVKCANQEEELAILSAQFEKNGIPYMPLKGSVIRSLFPQMYFREMSDLDILIAKDKAEAARTAAESVGYHFISSGEHHTEFQKLPYLTLELHEDLIPASFSYYDYYKDPWFKAKLQNGEYGYGMSKEDVYLYLLAHSAKHYYYCGTGIRSVIDVYVFNRAYRGEMDRTYLAAELKKLDLTGFAAQIEELAEYWFSGEKSSLSTETKVMQEYILSASTYGNKGMYMTNVIRGYMKDGKTERAARVKAYLQMVFLPLREMKRMYPCLNKAPVLLPFCWVARWFRIIFTKPKSITSSYKSVRDAYVIEGNMREKNEKH